MIPIEKLSLLFVAMSIVLLTEVQAYAGEFFISENGDVADGNEHLSKGELAEALELYTAAAKSLPDRNEIHLNRGLALIRMEDDQLDQAMQAMKLATMSGADEGIRARAHFNLGNTFFRKEDYETAIINYKKSLMLQPGNKDVAWNLEIARQKQKKKEEDQDKQDQDKQDQDKQDQDKQDQDKQDQDKQDQDKQDQDKQDQDKQDQDKQDQDKQDQDKQDQDKQDQDQDKQEQQEQPKTQQEMEQILDALDNTDENLMKNKARRQSRGIPVGKMKDW